MIMVQKELQAWRSWTMNLNVSEVVFYCLVVPIGIIHTTVAAAAFHFAIKCHCFQVQERKEAIEGLLCLSMLMVSGQWFMFMLLNCISD